MKQLCLVEKAIAIVVQKIPVSKPRLPESLSPANLQRHFSLVQTNLNTLHFNDVTHAHKKSTRNPSPFSLTI